MTKEEIKNKLGSDTYNNKTIFSKKFDCDYKKLIGREKDNTPNGCGTCVMCKYNNFKDFAESTCPSGGTIGYNIFLEKYIDLFGINK